MFASNRQFVFGINAVTEIEAYVFGANLFLPLQYQLRIGEVLYTGSSYFEVSYFVYGMTREMIRIYFDNFFYQRLKFLPIEKTIKNFEINWSNFN